ncbi:LuxR C-terminal-related transcriptional regulator [Micromonospora sp. NPDC050187]|uniref:helix-turn-helix domain-containing protein n=1 Tax=Micromonospora sp. NPDC050187 TaxID=3364277 RepID=UPI0037B64C27
MLLGPEVGARTVGFLTRGTGTVPPFPQLTEREREVLDHVACGLDHRAIAQRLALSPKTVRNHLSNVLVKLGVSDRGQAIVRAREQGLGRGRPHPRSARGCRAEQQDVIDAEDPVLLV